MEDPGPQDFFPIGVETGGGAPAEHAGWFQLSPGAGTPAGGSGGVYSGRALPGRARPPGV